MDTFDQDTRSFIMAQVRSKHTGLEEKFMVSLKAARLGRFTRHADDLPGKPDVIFKKCKVAVFIDSCFWHGCPRHLRRPGSNQDYWQAKIDRNVSRDRRVRAALRRAGWSVIRVWEHEMKNPRNAINRIRRALANRQQ